MATRFDNLTVAQLQQAVTSATLADYTPNATFYSGDHWQDGAGWVGPRPPMGDPASAQVLSEIKTAFVSSNKVKEVVRRHIGGSIGREPSWGLTVRRPLKQGKKPTAAEQKLIDEAEALLTEWWDERGIHTLLQDVTATLLLGSRASLRLFVPPARLVDGKIPQADLRTALFAIYAHQPALTQATEITDPATQQRAGIYTYTEQELLSTTIGESRVELTALDEQNRTVLRILRADGTIVAEADPLDLGGQLLLHELKRPLLVTEQIRENQKQLNLAKTMMGRNVVQGGFLERIILNGQLPGSYVDDASQPSGKRFVPAPFRVGAGTTNFIAGATYQDADGKTQIANPSVVYRDPVKVDTFEMTERAAYRSILEEAQQLHALISGDATASGESRKQARGDYEDDLGLTKTPIDRAGRWLLETALNLAAIFSGQPGRFASLRATFSARINTGPMSSEEIGEIQALTGDKPLLSQETGMSRIGIEDTDAELAKIAAETAAAAAPELATDPKDVSKDDPAKESGDPAADPAKESGAPEQAPAKAAP